MSILHAQFSAQAKTPEGKTLEVNPQAILRGGGPLLPVTVGVHDMVASEMRNRGMEVPAPIAGRALLDTGASVTCIDNAKAQELGLNPVGTANMSSASHSATQVNVYPVRIDLVGTGILISTQHAVGASLDSQGGLIALIGRDIMKDWTLFYNGPAGAITLSL